MKGSRIAMLVIGLVVLGVGIFFVLDSMGFFNEIKLGSVARTPTEDIGMRITSDFRRQNLFAVVAPGTTYHWKITVQNTGGVNWVSSAMTIRLTVPGATSLLLDASTIEGENWYGQLRYEQCNGLTDDPSCRENIGSGSDWNFQVRDWGESTWHSAVDPSCGRGICSIDLGAMAVGETVIKEFRMTAPIDVVQADRLLIGDLFAYTGANYGIDNYVDTISFTDTPFGTLTIEFLGAMMLSILGLVMAIGAFL